MKTIYKKLLFLFVFLPFSILAQSSLEGTVVDSKSKQPIPGVNVIIKGTPNGTSTDFDGKFKLPKINKGDVVVFSYIGYVNQTITFTSQKAVTIGLDEESNQLNEVVIQVGYGSAKKKDATGSVALVTSKDFNKGAIVSTDQLLAGKAAGVRITNGGGAPDQKPQILIRGGASLVASNDPLIIIDGVPISDTGTNPWNLINPNDVESFSILKDASATAIYGVRASNGVILITTKKGTAGAPQFNYSANISVGKITKALDVMNAADFVKFIQQYHPDRTNSLGIDDPNVNDNPATTDINEGLDNPSTPEIEGRILSDTNWQNQVFRTSINTDHTFSARANLYKKIPFRASVGYTSAQGLIKNNDYERLSYSFKMTPKFLNDNLKVDINAKGNSTYKNGGNEGAIGAALSMDPTKPVYGPSFNNKFGGYYQQTEITGAFNRDQKIGADNPLAILEQRNGIDRALRFLGNIEFDYKIPFLRDLRAVANFGLDATQSRYRETFAENAIATYTFNQGTDPNTNYLFNPGLSSFNRNTETNTTMDTYLVYSKSLTGFIRKVDGQAGYSYQNFKFDGNSLSFRNDPNTGIRETFISNANNPDNRYYSPLNLQAFFARGNVDVLGKYLFTATFRADASSLFTEENRWGYFPAVGAAWKIKEEKFLVNSNVIQDLKLRVGWGKTGQANFANNAGYFPSRLYYQLAGASDQYLEGIDIYTTKPYNADLTWEKTGTYNLGLDFEFFKNSIVSGSFDVYTRKTTDLLAVITTVAGQGTGATVNITNSGSIDSKGFESTLNVKVINTDNFSLSVGGNIAYAINKVVDLAGRTEIGGSGIGSNTYSTYDVVGRQRQEAYVYKQIYDASGKPIVGAYEDLNNDGTITLADRYLKPVVPNWTYGFNTNIVYKNWDLAANFRGQIGGQIYNQNSIDRGFIDAAAPPSQQSVLNNVLNFYNGSANPDFKNFTASETSLSDYFLEDATFLRCDNISLGYKFLKFVGKSSLRVSGAINNAFLITSYSGQDPESNSGRDGSLYPRPRTYTFGVSLDF
ncbi:SusC/RagA family TonB-linked outer membrane protein [Flavobacterium luteum]|uniref:SusC/RagA family TonB-linked outer membrane protein n=1 Tax=Flavobacterium luteum TaxID=2026654 RepID=A0A7J5AGR7_9FLAO|nr:SusC/RagA family TonB-linked outer membrane protein [Flavobacterium luteum]KAB1156199.1 SusC/RagA family TonB-linked outer membrane protein [Flavobacterium luteum]